MVKLMFTESATQFILDAFGIFKDRYGMLHDEFGEIIRFDDEGDPVTIENFGGIKKGENGEMIFLRAEQGCPERVTIVSEMSQIYNHTGK